MHAYRGTKRGGGYGHGVKVLVLCAVVIGFIVVRWFRVQPASPNALFTPPEVKGNSSSLNDATSTGSSILKDPWSFPPEASKDEAMHCSEETFDAARWFRRRYRAGNPPLFLNRNSYATRDMQVLIDKRRPSPFGVDKVRPYWLQRALSAALPKIVVGTGSCAVVGNAGNLVGSKLGPRIDAHTYVIRMNAAKVSDYEADVGSKTNLTLFNPDWAMDIEDHNSPYVFWTTKPSGYQWLERAFTHEGRLPHLEANMKDPIPDWSRSFPEGKPPPGRGKGVAVLHPGFIDYVHNVWNEGKGARPSTGQLAVILALQLCSGRVSIYGFDRHTEYSNQYHLPEDRSTYHDWEVETAVRQCLHLASKVSFPIQVQNDTTLEDDLREFDALTKPNPI
eukprot:1293431-Pyramimonas_sp.AAC.1